MLVHPFQHTRPTKSRQLGGRTRLERLVGVTRKISTNDAVHRFVCREPVHNQDGEPVTAQDVIRHVANGPLGAGRRTCPLPCSLNYPQSRAVFLRGPEQHIYCIHHRTLRGWVSGRSQCRSWESHTRSNSPDRPYLVDGAVALPTEPIAGAIREITDVATLLRRGPSHGHRLFLCAETAGDVEAELTQTRCAPSVQAAACPLGVITSHSPPNSLTLWQVTTFLPSLA